MATVRGRGGGVAKRGELWPGARSQRESRGRGIGAGDVGGGVVSVVMGGVTRGHARRPGPRVLSPLCPLQVGDVGLGGLILLLLTARPGPGDGAARGEPPEPGGSRGPLARSLQRAEAMLRSVTPGLRRLLSPRSSRRGDSDEDDEEDEDEAASMVVPLEQSFSGLRRCLCVWEDPRTETFLGYVRPHPGGAGDFSEDAVRRRVAERGAALHALLQHRHQLTGTSGMDVSAGRTRWCRGRQGTTRWRRAWGRAQSIAERRCRQRWRLSCRRCARRTRS
ncbi:PREDICTED: uncharacterized protein LOC101811176 [Ficedula albicollis]|uniref:uncharacterized protein LOC101811176 n=1 Tax=Ficedula albicollis TaxID=59894 RepID=UPI0003593AEE|nr:PREDICTED: uncharacterized protein LOC101811176 [Ficedula albicollis]